MKISVAVLMSVATLLASNMAHAGDEVPLKGTAFLDQEGCAKGTKSPNCILSFQISGKVAKLLFDGMPGKGQREECTGGIQKTDGNGLNCIKSDDGNFNCDFGYTFAKKSFTGSGVDC